MTTSNRASLSSCSAAVFLEAEEHLLDVKLDREALDLVAAGRRVGEAEALEPDIQQLDRAEFIGSHWIVG